jgi:hypothetical protein
MKRRSFDYQVGQQVLQLVPTPDKMQERAIGPFKYYKSSLQWYFDDSSISSCYGAYQYSSPPSF